MPHIPLILSLSQYSWYNGRIATGSERLGTSQVNRCANSITTGQPIHYGLIDRCYKTDYILLSMCIQHS
uniref:Uncharacterized protein n=1 Tax=Anguilla anguilla TaxID=7936 RepID=A0A0E9XZP5_ANGAN